MRRLAVLAFAVAAWPQEEGHSEMAVAIRGLEDPAQRIEALRAVERSCTALGNAAAPSELSKAVSPVLALVRKGETEVRVEATGTIGRVGSALLRIMGTDNPLGNWREEAGSHVATILRILTAVLSDRHEEDAVRQAAARELGTLVATFDAEQEGSAAHQTATPARAALATIGEAVPAAVEALLKVAGTDGSDMVRGEAILSLGAMKRKEATAVATAGLREPWKDVDHSSGSAAALMRIGERHAEARAALIDIAADEALPEGPRRAAASCLGQLGRYGHLGAEKGAAARPS